MSIKTEIKKISIFCHELNELVEIDFDPKSLIVYQIYEPQKLDVVYGLYVCYEFICKCGLKHEIKIESQQGSMVALKER